MRLMTSKVVTAVLGQLIAVLLVVWCFFSFNGWTNAMFVWALVLFGLLYSRYTTSKKASDLLHEESPNPFELKRCFRNFHVNIFLTGIFWGTGMSYFVLLAPENFKLFSMGIAAVMAGAGILTLATSFYAYSLFAIPMLILIGFSFLLLGSNLYVVAALASFIGLLYLLYTAHIHAQNFQSMMLQQTRIAQTELDLIHALGKAAEYKDEETGNHTLRMSHACYLVSKAYGMTEALAHRISKAATMHDIGKIGIPDEILLKPGKLTPEEFDLMKTHPNIGLSILEDSESELIKTARIIIENHHERWDGTGYPNQLKGNAIPIEGRIAAVCDVFDALISERPYKKGWPFEKALDYILQNKSTHFDPKVVDAFHQCYNDIVENAIEYSDGQFG